MPNGLRVIFGILLSAFVVASPLVYRSWRDKQCRNFHVVEAGILYRSGQLPLAGLQQVVATHGIRTVISLRDARDVPDPMDQQEEAWVKAKSLNYVRIPHKSWYPDQNGQVPAETNLKLFRDVMDNPVNYPVLVHCFAGIHRTGTMCAIYRMDYQGWTSGEAMAEMRVMGYTVLNDHQDVRDYFTNYRSQHAAKKVPALPVNRQNGIDP
jgi:tyrosine-protein phosphatase SIW14